MITLRPAVPDDEPFLWEMLALAVFARPGQPPVSPQIVRRNPELRRYVSEWGRAGDFGIIAETGGEPVGAAWARLMLLDEPGYGFVDEGIPELTIALMPGFRGKGLGSRLLTALLEAAEPNYPAISLSVSKENTARRLYRRFGFIAVGEQGSSVTMVHRF